MVTDVSWSILNPIGFSAGGGVDVGEFLVPEGKVDVDRARKLEYK